MTSSTFEYAPAPESRVDRRHRAVLRPVHRRRVRRRRDGKLVQDRQPGHRGGARRGRRGRRRRRRPRRQGRPPGATSRSGAGCPAAERAKYLFRIARHHPGALPRARRAGVARQRQADQGVPRRRRPAGRGALLLLRGLGRQARLRRLRARPAAARRRRPGHPVELPAADAGVEDRAGAGLRQHRRAQAGRDHPADRAAVRRDLPAGRPAAGRRQHRHRRRRHRPGAGRATRTSTRSRSPARPRSAGRSPARSPAPARRSPSSSAARPPTSSSTTPRSTRPSRASSTASSSTRATSAAPAPACWCRSRSHDEVLAPAQAPDGARCASATRSTRTPTSARSTPPSSSPGSASCPTSARPRAPSAGRRRASCPSAASGSRRRSSPASRQAHRIAREEIFGPVLSVLTFRTPTRRSPRPTTRRTACRPASGPRRARGSSGWPNQLRAGVVWANTFNKFDPTSPFGGYKESGYGREGGRHGLEAYLR